MTLLAKRRAQPTSASAAAASGHPPPGRATASNTSTRSSVSSWTVLNVIGLVVNLLILSATLTVYQRILFKADNKSVYQQSGFVNNNNNNNNNDRHGITTRRQTFQQPQPSDNAVETITEADETFHIIFSTGCSQRQDMQSYVLFHSIMESGQQGHATRIASGCTQEEAAKLTKVFEREITPMGKVLGTNSATGKTTVMLEKSRFHLHLTPEFGVVPHDDPTESNQKPMEFKYLNKPYGVAHWMENALGYSETNPHNPLHDETIVALLDPDMIILRPFVNDFSPQNGREIWTNRTSYPLHFKVQHGFPMAAEYAYANQWYDKIIKEQKLAVILPAAELPSPVESMTKSQISENYAAGPPYLATARDFYALAAKWRQVSIPVMKEFPNNILAEMFAYSWAAAHLNLPHQLANSFMVSLPVEAGFQLFHKTTTKTTANNNNNDHDDFLFTSTQMCRGVPTEAKPHILHYCQRYSIGKYILGKHRIPIEFLAHGVDSCQQPLLAEPPDNVALIYNFYIEPDTHKRYNISADKWGLVTQRKNVDRTAFLLCEEAAALNRAALYYKQQHCIGTPYNTEKSLIFHDSLIVTPKELTDYA